MISKEEIGENSERFGLSLDVIEKDYVLGWLLAGINNDTELRSKWIFKGGTCLKKCFFKDYRFSEDLDFTILDQAHIDADFLMHTFAHISAWLYEHSGIDLPLEFLEFKERENARGSKVVTGKISYHGPIRRLGSLPRVKLDLSSDELLVAEPVQSVLNHPYSDYDQDLFSIKSYPYPEIFAEKIRALVERALPRDLYDVVYLYKQETIRPKAEEVSAILSQKCQFKNLDFPNYESFYSGGMLNKSKDSWARMLRHQLRDLPSLDAHLQDLKSVFDWLAVGETC